MLSKTCTEAWCHGFYFYFYKALEESWCYTLLDTHRAVWPTKSEGDWLPPEPARPPAVRPSWNPNPEAPEFRPGATQQAGAAHNEFASEAHLGSAAAEVQAAWQENCAHWEDPAFAAEACRQSLQPNLPEVAQASEAASASRQEVQRQVDAVQKELADAKAGHAETLNAMNKLKAESDAARAEANRLSETCHALRVDATVVAEQVNLLQKEKAALEELCRQAAAKQEEAQTKQLEAEARATEAHVAVEQSELRAKAEASRLTEKCAILIQQNSLSQEQAEQSLMAKEAELQVLQEALERAQESNRNLRDERAAAGVAVDEAKGQLETMEPSNRCKANPSTNDVKSLLCCFR